MDFENALELLKKGEAVYRKGWNGTNMFIKLKKVDDSSDMTQTYIYLDCPKHDGSDVDARDLVPWLASQTDLLADDWQVVYRSSN